MKTLPNKRVAKSTRAKKTKKPKEPKLTLLQVGVQKYAHLIQRGTVLAIDPSSGSEGSMPGYAYYVQGELTSYGTIELPAGTEIHIRLQVLCRTLIDQFQVPDVLILENIAPYINGNSKGVINLHKSIGVVTASIPCKYLIEIAPMSWKTRLRRAGLEQIYVKSDVNDAIYMGHCVVEDAFNYLHAELPPFDFSLLTKANYTRA